MGSPKPKSLLGHSFQVRVEKPKERQFLFCGSPKTRTPAKGSTKKDPASPARGEQTICLHWLPWIRPRARSQARDRRGRNGDLSQQGSPLPVAKYIYIYITNPNTKKMLGQLPFCSLQTGRKKHKKIKTPNTKTCWDPNGEAALLFP